MSNEVESTADGIAKAAQMIVVAVAVGYILKWIWIFCELVTPADRNGRKNPFVTLVICLALVFGTYSAIQIFGSPASHPSSNYSPAEWRALVKRKCVFEDPSFSNNSTQVRCVALDAPDVPREAQNAFFYNTQAVADQYGLVFMDTDYLNLTAYRSNDPALFQHPVMHWKNHDRPGISIIRFWDWSML